MKKVVLVFLVFLAAQILVPIVGTFFIGLFETTTHTVAATPKVTLNPYVLGVELIISYIITIGGLYLWKLLLPKTGLQKHRQILPLAIVIMLFFMAVINIASEAVNLPNLMENQFDAMAKNPICILSIVLFAPITEEFVFRRAMLGSLLESGTKPIYAIIISVAFFALAHFNPAQMPTAFVLGCLLGWFFVRTGSIIPSIVCHIVNNALATIFMIYAPDEKMVKVLGGTSTTIIVALVSAVVAALLILWYKKLTEGKAIEAVESDNNVIE